MKNVKLNCVLIYSLIFYFSYQGCADCPTFVKSNTEIEAAGNKLGKGFLKIISFDWSNINFDEKLLQFIKVTAVNNHGPDGYFDPKIKVCDYSGNENCYILSGGTYCRQIYGTQSTGAGISAAAFIDWEGDKTKAGGEITQGLGWEWADGVTDEEKVKFANAPKICACSQKGACMTGISSWSSRVFSGENIFHPGKMKKVCDTCYQTKIKCTPVKPSPGPPPFCQQLAISPPQVRIVPIRDQDNDYFRPRVGVIVDGLGGKRDIYISSTISSKHDNSPGWAYPIPDKDDTIHYFKTYRKKGRLCAEYYGTEKEESKRKLQFPARCFPSPTAPEPEKIRVVDENTLEVKAKMDERVCIERAGGIQNNGICTFNVNAKTSSSIELGTLFLRVVKPAIVKKTTGNDNIKNDIDNILEGILKNNSQFKVLERYGYIPDIEAECKEFQGNKCKVDNLGYSKIELKYKENPKSKMLCLSGWQPEPEEFTLKKEGKLISLKSMVARYSKYTTVYSEESNQLYHFPCNKTIDLLANPQSVLNEIIFNKKGYIFIPKENKTRDHCMAKEDREVYTKQNCDKCKIVYELTDGSYEEKCKQGEDGCLCFNGVCSRSTQYIDRNGKPVYLRVSQEESGVVTKLDNPIKTNRAEVFFADKLCGFHLDGLKKRVREIIIMQLKNKKHEIERNNKESYELGDSYTDNLSIYDSVEIEAWGAGEAGHIDGKAQSTRSRPGMPGDYIKTKLKINPNYPYIKVKVTEGGGGWWGNNKSVKNGGPTLIKMCRDPSGTICKDLITVAGGGTCKIYGKKNYENTIIHEQSLKLEEEIVRGDRFSSRKENEIAYIKNGKIEYENVKTCDESYVNKKYGAGGCINENSRSYSRGATGHVKIKPIFGIIDEERVKKIDDAIENMIHHPDDTTSIDDSLIKSLNEKIIEAIKKEIENELSGS